jgi:tryptophan-rich sensory protein
MSPSHGLARSRNGDSLALFTLVGIALAVGSIGHSTSAYGIEMWYPTLNLPSWALPGPVFEPLGVVTFLVAGLAGWAVWRVDPDERSLPWTLWWLQLAFAFVWAPLVFGARELAIGVFTLSLLWICAAALARETWHVSRPAGILSAMYGAWVTYLLALTIAIWTMN